MQLFFNLFSESFRLNKQDLVLGQESYYNLDATDFAESKAIRRSVEGEGNLKQVVKTERKPDSKRLSFKSKNFLDRVLIQEGRNLMKVLYTDISVQDFY